MEYTVEKMECVAIGFDGESHGAAAYQVKRDGKPYAAFLTLAQANGIAAGELKLNRLGRVVPA